MRRSYGLYAATLIAVYALLTFFGELILTTLTPLLPVAGLQVDPTGLDFDSYEWPLLIAFGFAGATPLLPPLVVFEAWLRRRAHTAVGLPVRVEERTVKLLANLDPREADRGDLPDDLGAPDNLRTWVKTHLSELDNVDRVFRVRDDIELLIRWTITRGSAWPRREVREELGRLETEEVREAQAAIQEFEQIIARNYNEAPDLAHLRTARAEQDPGQVHRKSLETNLTAIVERMTRLRAQLASIVAVYAERDDSYARISPHAGYLHRLLDQTFGGRRINTGPEQGLMIYVAFAFALYTLFAATGWHALTGPAAVGPKPVLITAGIDTARLAGLLVLPAVAVFSVRMVHGDREEGRGRWHRVRLDTMPRAGWQIFWMLTLGFGVSLIYMTAHAWFYAALLSPDIKAYRAILYGGNYPAFWFFVSQSFVTLPAIFFFMIATDTPRNRPLPFGLPRVALPVAATACVLTLQILHLDGWGFACAREPSWLPLDPVAERWCFTYLGGLDLILYSLAAFLGTSVLIRDWRPEPSETVIRPAEPAPRGRDRLVGAAFGLAILFLILGSNASKGPADAVLSR